MTKPLARNEGTAKAIEHAIELYQEALLYASRGLPLDAEWRQRVAEDELRFECELLRNRAE